MPLARSTVFTRLVLIIALGFTAGAMAEDAASMREYSIEKLSPKLDGLISADAELELIGDRYGLTEGPLWVDGKDGGYLLFTDLISDAIFKWTESEGDSLFIDKAGYTGDDINNAGFQARRGRMRVILIGPNGLTLDTEGRPVWCAMPDRKVKRLEDDGSRTLVAETWEGKRFSGPNDVVVRSDGLVYFTDSIFGLRGAESGQQSPYREIPFNGVYLVKDGVSTLLVKDQELGGDPNGLAFSPDEKHLYISADYNRIMRYVVNADGTLGEGIVFRDGETSDGMKVDVQGNVYTTAVWEGDVRITSPEGERLGVIHLPKVDREPQVQICATNVAFGDADRKTLYITACEHNYRIRLNVAGTRPATRY